VEQNHVFDRVIANDQTDVLYRAGEGTQRFDGNFVTPGTFEFLGMPALIGRVMQPADYEPGAPPVFVLRYKTWVKSFGADPGIVNKTFVLNGESRTLIGIMPPRFGWGDADLWIPRKPERATATKAVAGAFPEFWFLLGHLKPGVFHKGGGSGLHRGCQPIGEGISKGYPKRFTVHIESLTNLVVGQFKTTLFIVLAAVGLLLLIGCGMWRIFSWRGPLRGKGACHPFGARRKSLETDPSTAGGKPDPGSRRGRRGNTPGLGRSQVPGCTDAQNIIPAEAVIRLNMPVLLFTLGVAGLTALVFGLVPAMKAARKDLNDPLRDSGKGISGGFRHGRLRDAVVCVGSGALVNASGCGGTIDAKFCSSSRCEAGFAARPCTGG